MNRLKHARTTRGLTLRQVANAIQTNVSTLSRIENGKVVTSRSVAQRILKFYEGQVTAADIYGIAESDLSLQNSRPHPTEHREATA